MKVIAIINEKGGTAKTTTTVNLAACLGELGKKILVIDLDGQGATSRWFGVEEDSRLSKAIIAGGGLKPIENVVPNVDLAPADGKLDSVAHDLRPTQGGQLRKVIRELQGQYDMVLIDCPPSLGNRLIGNAMLAATDALVPVETSILALDGLRILLTMLGDIRQGFDHNIRLMGVLACRYDARTRLSRLVLGEMKRALPNHVFTTTIRSNIRLQEAPAAQQSILDYAPDSSGVEDYRALAKEVIAGRVDQNSDNEISVEQDAYAELEAADKKALGQFRERAADQFACKTKTNSPAVNGESSEDQPIDLRLAESVEQKDIADEPVGKIGVDETESEAVSNLSIKHEEEPVDLAEQSDILAGRHEDEQLTEPLAKLGSLIDQAADDEEAPVSLAGKRQVKVRRYTSVAMSAAMMIALSVGWLVIHNANKPQSASAQTPVPVIQQQVAQQTTSDDIDDVVSDSATDQYESKLDSLNGILTEPVNDTDVNADVSDLQNQATATLSQEKVSETDIVSQPKNDEVETVAPAAVIPIKTKPLGNDLRLTATMRSGNGGLAIINGQTIELGQTYRNATLVTIGYNSVKVQYHNQYYRLAIGKNPVLIGDVDVQD